jgi:potassium efflux system protein
VQSSFGLVTLLLVVTSALAQPKAVHPKAPAADTAAYDESHRLEVAYTMLGEITGEARTLFDTRNVVDELPELNENLHSIRHSVSETGLVADSKQLQMCRLMLANIQEQLVEWRTDLSIAHEQLEAMQARLGTLARPPARVLHPDAALLELERADSALHVRQQSTALVLANRFQQVKHLQTQVAVSYIQSMELQDQVNEQMRRFGYAALHTEYPYLWAAGRAVQLPTPLDAHHAEEYHQKIIAYYFANNWDNWAFMGLIGLVFYGWVSFNYYRLRKQALAIKQPFSYLRPGAIAATLVVMFSLAPALELHPPPVYLDLLQALLLLALTIVFARSWSRQLFWYWLGLVVFFGALAVTNASATTGLLARWGLLLLNVLAISIGAFLLLRIRRAAKLLRFVVPITGVFVVLNLLAVVCNIFGRLSLAKMCSTAAIFGLTQGIGLAVFIELFTEAFHLQMLASHLKGGRTTHFDYAKSSAHLLRLLTGVAGGLWLLVFASNLNLHDTLYSGLSALLTTSRQLGSTEFTLGNIVLFFLIIFVSAQLQQYIGYFFGDVNDDDSPEARHRGSWLVALRLLLVVVGLGLATAATGLPLSKIAIVFGALSVGVGLGLQSVVNNLVSGIILLFERPFHVGDFIEVAGKSGRVQDIGIRSSKLTSLTGSEIIVPNGDLLAGHVINWTRTNDHIRTDLVLKLAPGLDLETDLRTARELIQAEVQSSPYTMQHLTPEILLSSINGQLYELKVLFWITNIRQQEITKSEILAGLYRRFTAQGLQLS